MITWKRVCAVMIAGVICTAGLPQFRSAIWETELVASAETTGSYGDLTYTAYSDCVYITDCDTSVTSVEIPEEIEGLPVTEICDNAFEDCTLLKTVTIPDQVKYIGDYAFANCTQLTDLTIPDSVVWIGNYAFRNCNSLESVTLSIYVEYVRTGAFSDCDVLQTITFENMSCMISSFSTTIPEQAEICCYENSTAYEYAKKFNRNYSIMASAASGFLGTDNQLQWNYRTDMAALTIFGEGAIPNYTSISEAPWKAYENNIKNIVIEDGITEIGDYAFYEMDNVKSVTISDTVTRIGCRAFDETFIDELEVPASVETIESYAFCSCHNVMIESPFCTLADEIVSEDGYSLLYGFDDSTVETYAKENGIAYSNMDGTYGVCGNDATWTLNAEGVLTISGTGAIFDFVSYADDTISEYDNPMTTPWYKVRDQITEVVVENGITSVGDWTFGRLVNAVSASIANSVEKLGSSVFEYSAFSNITMSQNVQNIGELAFFNCTNLTSFIVPKSVTDISWHAFYNSSLTTVIILNPECFIYDDSSTIPSDTVIYGYSGSTAETYAKAYDRSFVALDDSSTFLLKAADVSLTLNELKAANYQVEVPVFLMNNPGIEMIDFGAYFPYEAMDFIEWKVNGNYYNSFYNSFSEENFIWTTVFDLYGVTDEQLGALVFTVRDAFSEMNETSDAVTFSIELTDTDASHNVHGFTNPSGDEMSYIPISGSITILPNSDPIETGVATATTTLSQTTTTAATSAFPETVLTTKQTTMTTAATIPSDKNISYDIDEIYVYPGDEEVILPIWLTSKEEALFCQGITGVISVPELTANLISLSFGLDSSAVFFGDSGMINLNDLNQYLSMSEAGRESCDESFRWIRFALSQKSGNAANPIGELFELYLDIADEAQVEALAQQYGLNLETGEVDGKIVEYYEFPLTWAPDGEDKMISGTDVVFLPRYQCVDDTSNDLFKKQVSLQDGAIRVIINAPEATTTTTVVTTTESETFVTTTTTKATTSKAVTSSTSTTTAAQSTTTNKTTSSQTMTSATTSEAETISSETTMKTTTTTAAAATTTTTATTIITTTTITTTTTSANTTTTTTTTTTPIATTSSMVTTTVTTTTRQRQTMTFTKTDTQSTKPESTTTTSFTTTTVLTTLTSTLTTETTQIKLEDKLSGVKDNIYWTLEVDGEGIAYLHIFTDKPNVKLTSTLLTDINPKLENRSDLLEKVKKLIIDIDGVKSIGDRVFYPVSFQSGMEPLKELMSHLDTVDISASVTEINEFAFCQNSLKTLIFSETLTTIGQSAFSGTDISQIWLRMSEREIWEKEMTYSTWLSYLEDDIRYLIADQSDLELTDEMIDAVSTMQLRTVGAVAFYDCEFSDLILPANTETIDPSGIGWESVAEYNSSIQIDGFTIYGWTNSAAQKYANSTTNQLDFVAVDKLGDESRGDVNLDGKVDGTDAYLILVYYAQKSVGIPASFETITGNVNVSEDELFRNADVDENSKIDPSDAFYVLQYYTSTSVGKNVTWDQLISA